MNHVITKLIDVKPISDEELTKLSEKIVGLVNNTHTLNSKLFHGVLTPNEILLTINNESIFEFYREEPFMTQLNNEFRFDVERVLLHLYYKLK